MKFIYSLIFTIIVFSIFSYANDGNSIQVISSPLKFEQQDFDVLGYNAELNFTDLPGKTLIATNEITLNWVTRTDSSKFYFHLRGLNVDSVLYDNKKISFLKIGDSTSATFHYELAPPVANKKDTAIVKVFYRGTMTNEGKSQPWGGVHYDDSLLYALGVGFLNNYIGTTQHWLACYDHPSDKATFHGKFIVPTGNYVAAGGNCVISYPDNGTDVFDYSIDFPTSPDVLTFNIGKLFELKFEGSSVPVSVFADHQDTTAARFAFKLVPDMVNYFSEILGTYPFSKVGYALTKKGSMESQEMINYYRPLVWSQYSQKDSTNLTAAHELSHMWFGNSATPFDFRDAWLNESWATFSESLWREKLGNYNSYLNEQEKKINLYYNNIVKLEGSIPLYDFPRNPSTSNYPTTIYYKGAVVVGMLRYKLGDSLFFRAVQGFLKKYKYSNLNTSLLQTFFEQISQTKLTQFFDQWVYNPGWPKVKATVIYHEIKNGEYVGQTLKIEQTKNDGWGYQKGGYFFDLPIEVTLNKKDGSKKDTILTMNGDLITMPLNGEQFATLQLNRGSRLRTLMQIVGINYEQDVYVKDDSDVPSVNYKLFGRMLNVTINRPENCVLKIYDILGNEVLSSTYLHQQNILADLNEFPIGFYNFVLISNGQVIYTNKIILN